MVTYLSHRLRLLCVYRVGVYIFFVTVADVVVAAFVYTFYTVKYGYSGPTKHTHSSLNLKRLVATLFGIADATAMATNC